MPGDDAAFSNPMAPADHAGPAASHPLRNEDFRKLMMTPRVVGDAQRLSADGAPPNQRAKEGGPKRSKAHFKRKPHLHKKKQPAGDQAKAAKQDAADDEEDNEQLDAILKNYRDRARERRDGEDKVAAAESELLQLSAGYRAVGQDARAMYDAAARRKQSITESKYLGGDMEHTHLVKGLDYSLLQKMRSEIVSKEKEDAEMDALYKSQRGDREQVETQIKSALTRNIHRLLFKDDAPKVNELFAPRRMAYVIEIEDEYADDIPTTLVRSKHDCPVDEASTNLSTNDMVIQKLTQVLSYLRTDTKRKKKDKGGKPVDNPKSANQGIYDDVGEYVPDRSRRNVAEKQVAEEGYFEKSAAEKEKPSSSKRGGRSRHREREPPAEKPRDETELRLSQGWAPADLQRQRDAAARPSASLTQEQKDKGLASVFSRVASGERKAGATTAGVSLSAAAPDSYAECYPGGLDAFQGNEESDDDDYSKMDMGNKKGPIRRWDFESEEDYETYMSKREALPKAAFQYGVKMAEGRKTRKHGGQRSERDDKQKIDRQWDQISRILAKRKAGGETSGDAAKKQKQ